MDRYDLIVVGAGPAGMMAAGQAASQGVRTLLLERMDQPGRKLKITGKGRCNLTNIVPLDDFISHFNSQGRFLYSAFARFFADDLITFFNDLGVATTVERGGRVFPLSSDAQEIVDALVRWLEARGVIQRAGFRVTRLVVSDGVIQGLEAAAPGDHGHNRRGNSPNQVPFRSQAVLLATGGASYPGTGSTGDGYRLAQQAGHTIVPVRPALVPIDTAGNLARRLQGLTLRNVQVYAMIDGEKTFSAFGEMLFTHFGLSGPIILTMSREIVDALKAGSEVEISIDLKPALDEDKLDARLLRDIDQAGNKQFMNLLKGLLPRKMIPVCLEQVQIPADKQAHQVTSTERARLLLWLKDFRLPVTGHRSIAQAIVTAGGVATDEIDPRTMQSRLVERLYFAGEVIDVDADTGGFNLQAAFSTGWLAGRSAAAQIKTLKECLR